MEDLRKASELPWSKAVQGKPSGPYVCTSKYPQIFTQLSSGDEQANWSDIVQALCAPQMQFREDSFWRLKGPYLRNGDTPIKPTIENLVEAGKNRQSQAVYYVPENASWRFELLSEVAKGTNPSGQIVVEATTSDDKVIKFSGNSNFSLRRYSGTPVEFRSMTAELLGTSLAEMTFHTTPQPTDWVTGANFRLKFRVTRNKKRIGTGIAAGFMGSCALVVGDSKLLDCHPVVQILLKVAGIALGAISLFLLTGKITFPSK